MVKNQKIFGAILMGPKKGIVEGWVEEISTHQCACGICHSGGCHMDVIVRPVDDEDKRRWDIGGYRFPNGIEPLSGRQRFEGEEEYFLGAGNISAEHITFFLTKEEAETALAAFSKGVEEGIKEERRRLQNICGLLLASVLPGRIGQVK